MSVFRPSKTFLYCAHVVHLLAVVHVAGISMSTGDSRSGRFCDYAIRYYAHNCKSQKLSEQCHGWLRRPLWRVNKAYFDVILIFLLYLRGFLRAILHKICNSKWTVSNEICVVKMFLFNRSRRFSSRYNT